MDKQLEHKIERLEENRMGKRWTKGTHDRFYFNLQGIAFFLNMEVDFYGTGSVRSAKLNGETISNTKARKILNAMDGSWLNLTNGNWAVGHFEGIETRFIEAFNAWNPDEE